MKQEFSIPALAARIATEADAYKLLEELRWPDGTPDSCPQCGAAEKFYFLAPKDGGDTRKTRTGADTARRLWKCATCRKKFSVLSGTVLHGTKVSIRSWLFAFFEVCQQERCQRAGDGPQVRPDPENRLVPDAPHPGGDEARPAGLADGRDAGGR
jgi:hypothetical protein